MARLTAYEARQMLSRSIGIPHDIECKSLQVIARNSDYPVVLVELRLRDSETIRALAQAMEHIQPVVGVESAE